MKSAGPAADFSAALSALQDHYRRMLNDVGPGPGRYDRFLALLHGPGWKERAIAAGISKVEPGMARRIRELERRVDRIERHLSPGPDGG
jgi:hypothetical protein